MGEEHDMGHMDHLEAVAAADVAHLREKERTYRGSWKRRGGVGAWMMACRKFDRLEGMLSQETPAERGGYNWDIFAAIRSDPSGVDGCPLAEVRDLRRYLLLAEAEMVSQGVVRLVGEPPAAVKVDTRPQARVPDTPTADFFDRAAAVWGVTVDEAALHLTRIAFGAGQGGSHRTPQEVMDRLQFKWRQTEEGVYGELARISWGDPDTAPRTDSNWHATAPRPPAMRSITDGLPVADYIAAGLHYLSVPRLSPLLGGEKTDALGTAIVDRRHYPDLDHLPRLAPELNQREWEEAPAEYCWMYNWSGEKHLLREAYREHWGREA